MTDLHDQFAMAAMPALIMMGRTEEKVAELAYKQADAMLAEREKKQYSISARTRSPRENERQSSNTPERG